MENSNKEKYQEDELYNPELDLAIKRLSKMNVKRITLKDIDELKNNREIKRNELIQDAMFNAALFADAPEESGAGGGGLGL